MLTDIFAERYSNTRTWSVFGDRESRLLVQGFRVIAEQLRPYWTGGKESEEGKAFWKELHNRISMELGMTSLSALAFSTKNPAGTISTHLWTMDKVCENWMVRAPEGNEDIDRFMKERIRP